MTPTSLPGHSVPVLTLPQATLPDAVTYQALHRQANALAVEVLLDSTGLPRQIVVPGAEGVLVTVAEVDDLGEWLTALGGEIHVGAAFEGVETWVLHTATEEREDGSSTPVLVAVLVPAGELVMDWIRAAVVSR